MSIHDLLDHWQYTLQCSVFYRDDQKVNTFCLLRCLHMKIIFLIIDHDSIFLQTLFALSFCHDPQIISQLFSQTGNKITANGTCTNDSNCLDFHFSILLKNTAADWNDIPVSGCTIILNILTIMHEFRGSHHRQDSHRTHNHYPAG